MGNAGQTCICANRFFVQSSVYEAFAEKPTAAVRRPKVGNGLEEGVTQGPLINTAAVEKVERHIADAVSKGGRLVAGGRGHVLGHVFFKPTVIVDATPDMLIATEETFGPLAALFRFDTEEQAIALTNDSEAGLAGYFYSCTSGASGASRKNWNAEW